MRLSSADWPGRARVAAAAFSALLALAPLSAVTDTLEDWQLQAGPFVTASDVRPHNGLPQDAGDIAALLAQASPDFRGALEVYAFGRHFPWQNRTHSLGRFADDYNQSMAGVVPVAVAHFGGPTYQSEFLFSALAGTRQFQRADEATRAAAVEGGALAVILNWCRFELGMSERKALAAEPNWSLDNGSPKNWNEIFAFYWGPEGQHSVYAAVAALPGGDAVNEALLAALAEGQEAVVAETWNEEAAAEVEARLHQAGELLLADALARAVEADDAALPAAVMRAAGFWLAAAESVVAADPAAAEAIDKALTPNPDRAAVVAAAELLAKVTAGG